MKKAYCWQHKKDDYIIITHIIEIVVELHAANGPASQHTVRAFVH